MGYRTILVATDGSETAVRAQRRAATLARAFWARLVIATAYREPDLPRSAAEDVLAYARQDVLRAEVEVDTEAVQGDPGEAVADAAKRGWADLVVAGNVGMGRSRRLRLGSIAERIANAAPCDVLIVHTATEGATEPTRPYERVLIATDGSETATEAARKGFELAEVVGAEVTLVFVGDPLLGAIALERTLDGRPGTAPATTVTREGEPAEEICAVARESGAAVVVVGNKGLTGLRGRLLGSVPAAVAHASPVDVLIARTTGRTAADLAPGTGAVVDVAGQKAAVYVDDDGVRHVVSSKCQHLGCTVSWNGADRTWDCPCHGSRYTFDGKVIHGPATRDLPPIDARG